MKRIFISLIILCSIGAVHAINGGQLTVTSVDSEEVTGITVITYNLIVETDKTGATYDITVEVSFNDGVTYLPVLPAHLSGDVEGVSPGTGKRITWDGGAGFPNRFSEETRVRLTATPDVFICGVSTVRFMYNESWVTYGTVVGANGRCWLDRNLGASQVATKSNDTEAYGDLFQWGRLDDGHQVVTWTSSTTGDVTPTTSTLSDDDVPGHDNFITVDDVFPDDWRSGQNANLWQGVNGTNNPCPPGYRLPTADEWQAEINSWSPQNATGALGSPLQLPIAGLRSRRDGSLGNVGSIGSYWSSTVSGTNSRNLAFNGASASMVSYYRANGASVRCIKDQAPLK